MQKMEWFLMVLIAAVIVAVTVSNIVRIGANLQKLRESRESMD